MDAVSKLRSPTQQLNRCQIINAGLRQVPVTNGGVPIGFYRADLIPPEADEEDISNILDASFVQLSFQHGYPTLNGGLPIWAKLEYEPPNAFSAFSSYLEAEPREIWALTQLPEIGYLTLGNLDSGLAPSAEKGNGNGNGEGSDCGSSAQDPSTPIAVPSRGEIFAKLEEWQTLYYWRSRAKAFDIYREAAYRAIRSKRAMDSEDYHYRLAAQLLSKVTDLFNQPDFLKDLSAKDALNAIRQLVSIQRLSAGLSASNPMEVTLIPTGELPTMKQTSFEAEMKQVVEEETVREEQLVGISARHVASDHATLRKVLDDSGATQLLQEVVIRVTTSGQSQAPKRRFGALLEVEDIESEMSSDLDGAADLANLAPSAEEEQ